MPGAAVFSWPFIATQTHRHTQHNRVKVRFANMDTFLEIGLSAGRDTLLNRYRTSTHEWVDDANVTGVTFGDNSL